MSKLGGKPIVAAAGKFADYRWLHFKNVNTLRFYSNSNLKLDRISYQNIEKEWQKFESNFMIFFSKGIWISSKAKKS